MTDSGEFDARPVRAFLPGPDVRVDETVWPASVPAVRDHGTLAGAPTLRRGCHEMITSRRTVVSVAARRITGWVRP
jgi:hypothetical protein